MNEEERQAKLTQLAQCSARTEQAYNDMYEAHTFSQANAPYSDAKESLYDAIQCAEELGLTEQADSLKSRLSHIKSVFRNQFTQ
jgi:cellobiose-specific phosphotransferase system component IIA